MLTDEHAYCKKDDAIEWIESNLGKMNEDVLASIADMINNRLLINERKSEIMKRLFVVVSNDYNSKTDFHFEPQGGK